MKRLLVSLFLFCCLASCLKNSSKPKLFEYIDSSKSQIHFINTIKTDTNVNIIDFQYCYNGGGVGIGDFNKDGLPDIVFTGNQVGASIYLNKGDFEFFDVTETSGIKTDAWLTGVSIIDINADGLSDIYLNVGGPNCENDCQNLLYVHQGKDKEGVPIFKEQAAQYGLSDPNYSQQTVFFDYDLDGDLDAYILRNGNVKFDKNSPIPKQYFPEHLSDALMENTQIDTLDHPIFVDVSEKMGIVHKGFGLGLGINDFDENGLVDVYVGNDFISNDLLYLNYGKRAVQMGFKERSKDYFQHQTYNSMGLDIADLNGDSRPDLLVLDMLPEDYERQKKMLGALNYDKYNLALRNDYSPQFMRNTLQINNGFVGNKPVKFSDVSFFTKTAQTDWSWSPLIADYDMDGDNDIFVTNGYGKDITNLDFINYTQQNNIYGTPEARNARLKKLVEGLPAVKMSNYFFENLSNLDFEDRTGYWVLEKKSLSNGAAFADFDLDGDLDLVVNNIDEKAFVLKNNASDKMDFNFLKVKLKGPAKNSKAIGAKITIWQNDKAQTHFQSVIRGYLSTVEDGAYFGLTGPSVDSIQVIWPSGKETKLIDISSNQTLNLDVEQSVAAVPTSEEDDPLFLESLEVVSYRHTTDLRNEFVKQHLLQTQHAVNGPILASTSIEKGKPNMLFVGGGLKGTGYLLKENAKGKFDQVQEFELNGEVSDAVFMDIDGDEDQDLYIAYGGNNDVSKSSAYQDEIYLNLDNRGFVLSSQNLPDFRSPTSCVRRADYDNDGDLDVFVGSNIVPNNYPSRTENILLENREGRFTVKDIPGLEDLGMVKDAVWADIDLDGWQDLLIVGDWMPIKVLRNEKGQLKPLKTKFTYRQNELKNTSGWYRAIASGDWDGDGDPDFIVGNQGQNNFVNPSLEYPMYIYKKDFDDNGSIDPVIGAYFQKDGKKELLPLNSRDDIMKQLPQLKSRFNSYDDFTKTDFKTLLRIQDLKEDCLQVTNSKSIYLENMGNGNFVVNELPNLAQHGPVNSVLVDDYDNDGHLDALLAGNDFYAESVFGRFDALMGVFLKGNGDGTFKAIPPSKSGFYVPNHTSSLIQVHTDKEEKIIMAGQSNDSLRAFVLRKRQNKLSNHGAERNK